jgi:hypothetical protein
LQADDAYRHALADIEAWRSSAAPKDAQARSM